MYTPQQIEDSRNRLGASFYSATAVQGVPLDRQTLFGKTKNGKGIIDRLQAVTLESTASRFK